MREYSVLHLKEIEHYIFFEVMTRGDNKFLQHDVNGRLLIFYSITILTLFSPWEFRTPELAVEPMFMI